MEPQLKRDVLPIPDISPVGLTTYDAKDPDTSFPPIEQRLFLIEATKYNVLPLGRRTALVADDYPLPNTFTGEVTWVQIDVAQPLTMPTIGSTWMSCPGWPWRGTRRRSRMTCG